jgi:hypothetical protein
VDSGEGGALGVGGTLELCCLRFQKPAFGPFMIKASVHRDRPRRESGRWIAAVRSEEIDNTNAILFKPLEKRKSGGRSIGTNTFKARTVQLFGLPCFHFLPRYRVSTPQSPSVTHKVPSHLAFGHSRSRYCSHMPKNQPLHIRKGHPKNHVRRRGRGGQRPKYA